jgi:hypothetical protein
MMNNNPNLYGNSLGQNQGSSSPRTNEEMQYIALNGQSAFAEREARKLSAKELERLRDEFAIAALPSCYRTYVDHAVKFGWDDGWKDGVASDAYQIADSMMKAREQSK